MNKTLLELLQISSNIYNIYQNLSELDEQDSKYKKQFERLELALEYENKLYHSLSLKEMKTLLQEMQLKFSLKEMDLDEKANIACLELPLYRVFFHLKEVTHLKNEDDRRYLQEILPEYGIEMVLKEQKKMRYYRLVIDQQFYLNYLNLCQNYGSMTKLRYYQMIFLNRSLEDKFRHQEFEPIALHDTNSYSEKNWLLFPMPSQVKESILEYYKRELLGLLFAEKDPFIDQSSYLFACFFTLTDLQKEEVIVTLKTLKQQIKIAHPHLSSYSQRIHKFISHIFYIQAEEKAEYKQKEEITRKK